MALFFFVVNILNELQDVRPYNSFSEMLVAEGLQNVLPGVKTTDEGGVVALMNGIYLPITAIYSYIISSSMARLVITSSTGK